MYPRQYQQPQQSVNQAAAQYRTTNVPAYQHQSRNGIQDYSLLQGLGAQLPKQSTRQGDIYTNFSNPQHLVSHAPYRAVHTPSPTSSMMTQQLAAMHGLQSPAIQHSTSLPQHWPSDVINRANHQIPVGSSQGIVQQSLNQLGIPSSSTQSSIHHARLHYAQSDQQINRLNLPPMSQGRSRPNIINRSSSVSQQHSMSPRSSDTVDLTSQLGSHMPHSLSTRGMTHWMNHNAQPVSHSGVTSQPSVNHVIRSPISMLNVNNQSPASALVQDPSRASQLAMPAADRRGKIHIQFPANSVSPITEHVLPQQARKRSVSGFSDTGSSKEDGPSKPKQKLLLDETRVVIDDDLEIVGCKEAEVMSHIRADCPIHNFVRVDSVSQRPDRSNMQKCDKCYCYICDKLASECSSWTSESCPHCNAHAKSSCWKARRNMKKSPLMNILTSEETTLSMAEAGERAMRFIIQIREAYITYRAGIPCDFHAVPCDCHCHKDGQVKAEGCINCKAVHDLKKRFNYEPVRKVIFDLLKGINRDCNDKPESALVLLEALLSELCSHRPADFNHVTRRPSNPDAMCQCTTPQIMDEHIEPALIQIFALNEIAKSFKDKFLQCVRASVQPLQLKDVMKRFFAMRHWDDLLLRAVVTGQNTSGRGKGNDVLKESPDIVQLRVQKLYNAKRYQAILRYVKTVKVQRPAKPTDALQSNFVEKWILHCSVRLGKFKEVCLRLVDNPSFLQSEIEDVLELFTLMTGKDSPSAITATSSFNQEGGSQLITGVNQTALLILFIIFVHVNQNASKSSDCHLWLAKWVNTQKSSNIAANVKDWFNVASHLVDVGSKIAKENDRRNLFIRTLRDFDHQVHIFVCTLLLDRLLKHPADSMSCIEDVQAAYENNEWALFYLYSQPLLLAKGNHLVMKWLTNYIKLLDCSLNQFNVQSVLQLIRNGSWNDVFLFVQALLSSTWSSYAYLRPQAVKIAESFALRLDSEPIRTADALEFLSRAVLQPIIDLKLQNIIEMKHQCITIARVCCLYGPISNLDQYRLIAGDDEAWHSRVDEIFIQHEKNKPCNQKTPQEIANFFYYAVKEDKSEVVRKICYRCTDNHDCTSNTSILLLEQVVKILSDNKVFDSRKSNMMMIYKKLCSHEALNWLICPACSSEMPSRWMEVWRALDHEKMTEILLNIVRHTFQQFSSWMKELCVSEEKDIQRLFKCLRVFVANVVGTLLQCNFNSGELKQMLLGTGQVVASSRLREGFEEIIHNEFALRDPVRNRQNVVNSSSVGNSSHRDIATPRPPDNAASATNLTVSTREQTLAPVNRRRESSHGVLPVATGAQTPHDNSVPVGSSASVVIGSPASGPLPVNQPPLPKPVKNNLDVGRTDHSPVVESRREERSPQTSATITAAVRSLPDLTVPSEPDPASLCSAPSAAEPTTPSVCPRCGDAMSSSFRCSTCLSRRPRDVTCPSCGEVNRDLKGYSCRLCYTSLLGVLTSAEQPQTSPPPPQQKKKVKKKKKKLHREHSEDSEKHQKKRHEMQRAPSVDETNGGAPRGNINHSDAALHRSRSQENEIAAERKRVDLFVKRSHSHKEKSSLHASMEAPLKIRVSKDPVGPSFRSPQKERTRSTDAAAQREPISQSGIGMVTAKSTLRSPNHPHTSNHRPTLLSPERTRAAPVRQLSELPAFQERLSSSSEEGELSSPGRKIPPLILKRKVDEESVNRHSPLQVSKKSRPESNVSRSSSGKGMSMSKKQRNILNRLKHNDGFRKTSHSHQSIKIVPVLSPLPPKPHTAEVARRRRPGPASRTSYYYINPKWNVPKHLRLPYRTHLPKICRVQLSSFPPNIMQMIHEHQPSLRLSSLFA